MIKIKWPFCMVKTMKTKLNEMTTRIQQINKNHETELYECKKDVKDLILKLTKVVASKYEPAAALPQFRICVDIDQRMIRDVLIWGNDQKWIKYMGHVMGLRFEEELKSINFARYKDEIIKRG